MTAAAARPGLFTPLAVLDAPTRERGLHTLVVEAAFSGGTAALTSGVVLNAFALHLGASAAMIGLLASIPFLAQLLQLPAIGVVERWRSRKTIAVVTSLIGRAMLALMALTAFWGGAMALWTFVAAQVVLAGFGAVGSCAWNSWIRDLAPDDRLGAVIARRTLWLSGISLILGLAAALALEWTAAGTFARNLVFAVMFAAGCITGLASAAVVATMPEPAMPPPAGPVNLIALLRLPFADANFRRLLRFIVSWQFAVNFATPFLTVFIVRQLRFDLSFVMMLGVASQLANLAALRLWGTLSDRFANKSVLGVCAPVYIVAIVAMIGASQIRDRDLVMLWLVALHAVMGAAVAGVTLASTNIALKLSPRGTATAYVAASAVATALAAGTAPLIGGMLAHFFVERRLELVLRWSGPNGIFSLPLILTRWDFYFLIAGLIGLYALHRLSLVAEQGEIDRRAMVYQVLAEARRSIRNVSSVAGLRGATDLPGTLLRDARLRARLPRARRHRSPHQQERG